LRSGLSASILVAVLVGVTVLVLSLAPRALVQMSGEQLRHTLGELSPVQRDISVTGLFGYFPYSLPPTTTTDLFGSTAARLEGVPSHMSEPLATIINGAEWVIRTSPRRVDPVGAVGPVAHPVIALAVDLDWSSRIDFVEGTAPAAWDGNERDGVDQLLRTPIDIALSADSAKQLNLAVGDVLEYSPAPLRVSGIYEPRDSHAEYWIHALDLAAGEPRHASDGGLLVYASAYIDPASALGLLDTIGAAQVTAWYPVDVDRLEFSDAVKARDEAKTLMALGGQLPSGELMAFQSGFPNAIDTVIERVTLVTSLLALAVSGPLGVVLAVFALGVQSVLAPRRSALTLASARGGSATQLRLLMALEGLLIALPSAALGVLAAALLLPVPVGPEAYILPMLFALAVPVLLAIGTSSASLRSSRADLAVWSRGGTRWVIELAVLGLALLAVYLLFRRGFAESSLAVGIDPLLVATPLLLSLAVCVVVLRLYPGLMIAVQRWTRARRGAVGLVGAARAVRAPALGFAAALALVVGISIAVFSTVFATTVSTGLAANAQATAGADLSVRAANLDEEVVAALYGANGVVAAAGLERIANVTLSTGNDEQTVTVVLADFDALSQVRPDLDLPVKKPGLQFLASDDLAELGSGSQSTIGGTSAVLAGTIPVSALPNMQPRWILIDAADAGLAGLEFRAQELLLKTDESANRPELATAIDSVVRDAQPDDQRESVHITDASALLSVANAEPVVAGLRVALLLAALLTTLLSVLAVVLSSLSAAPARNRLIGVLRMLGMSPRQLSGLVVWELAPVAITAIVAGTALGIAELWLVTAALDLRPFLNGTVSPTPSIDLALVSGVVVGFALVVTLAGVVTTAIGRRFSPASSVKIGVE
jgi:putative ABC transport system permease protein